MSTLRKAWGGVAAGAATVVVIACVGDDPGLTPDAPDASTAGLPDVSPGDAPARDEDASTGDDAGSACGHACAADEACVASACVKQAIDVSAGATSACAVRKDGTVWCWGENRFGEIGVDTAGDVSCGFPCRPRAVQVPGLHDIAQVSVGYEFACAVDTSNIAYCWGKNHRLQSGHDNTSDPKDGNGVQFNPTPMKVNGLPAVTSVAAGTELACALSTVGGVWCWGNGGTSTSGNLWDTNDASVPTLSATPVPAVTDLASGVDRIALAVTYAYVGGYASNHMCAHKTDGTIWCWGESAEYERGASVANASLANAVRWPDGGVATGLGPPTIGIEASCALLAGGTIGCWGYDNGGYFGNGGNGTGGAVLGLAPGNTGGPALTSMAGVGAHVCGIAADKSLYCWGASGAGQLGAGLVDGGLEAYHGTAVSVPGFKANKVSTGGALTVAIRDDGTVWAWGNNTDAEIGHPYASTDHTPCLGGSTYCTPTPSRVLVDAPDAGPDAGL